MANLSFALSWQMGEDIQWIEWLLNVPGTERIMVVQQPSCHHFPNIYENAGWTIIAERIYKGN